VSARYQCGNGDTWEVFIGENAHKSYLEWIDLLITQRGTGVGQTRVDIFAG
jgi:hypothetical protein